MTDGFAGRFDVLEEPGRRREWADDVKARIVAESFAPGTRVVDVARRHRLLPSQLATWRRHAREGRLALPEEAPGLAKATEFVPLLLEASDSALASDRSQDRIEVEADGVLIRLPVTTGASRLVEIVSGLRSTRA